VRKSSLFENVLSTVDQKCRIPYCKGRRAEKKSRKKKGIKKKMEVERKDK
jgi:hypothetical protein